MGRVLLRADRRAVSREDWISMRSSALTAHLLGGTAPRPLQDGPTERGGRRPPGRGRILADSMTTTGPRDRPTAPTGRATELPRYMGGTILSLTTCVGRRLTAGGCGQSMGLTTALVNLTAVLGIPTPRRYSGVSTKIDS